jgi:hypothetical protein
MEGKTVLPCEAPNSKHQETKEIRNPNIEIRNKYKIQNPNARNVIQSARPSSPCLRVSVVLSYPFGIWNFPP